MIAVQSQSQARFIVRKTCSCGQRYTKVEGTVLSGMLWFNCKRCDSTMAARKYKVGN